MSSFPRILSVSRTDDPEQDVPTINLVEVLARGITPNELFQFCEFGFGVFGEEQITALRDRDRIPASKTNRAVKIDILFKLINRSSLDINGINEYGDTALHIVVSNKREQFGHKLQASFINLLINAGANVRATNSRGETPISIARALDRDMVEEFIRKQASCLDEQLHYFESLEKANGKDYTNLRKHLLSRGAMSRKSLDARRKVSYSDSDTEESKTSGCDAGAVAMPTVNEVSGRAPLSGEIDVYLRKNLSPFRELVAARAPGAGVGAGREV